MTTVVLISTDMSKAILKEISLDDATPTFL
jgi:hypothetical protein